MVCFCCHFISCALAWRGVRRGADEVNGSSGVQTPSARGRGNAVGLTSILDWGQFFSGFDFDLISLVRLPSAIDYICTNFDVDSLSRLPFRARTHRHTKAQTQMIIISHTFCLLLACRNKYLACGNCYWVPLLYHSSHLICPHIILTECMRDRSQSQQTGSLHSARPSSPWSRQITGHSVQIKLETYKHSYRQAYTLDNEWPRHWP